MTRLTYRGNMYYKEAFLDQDRQEWNYRHRPSLWLRYRGRSYRPVQVGGRHLKGMDKLQTSDSL